MKLTKVTLLAGVAIGLSACEIKVYRSSEPGVPDGFETSGEQISSGSYYDPPEQAEDVQETNAEAPRSNSLVPVDCWTPGVVQGLTCEGFVTTGAFPFCPTEELYVAAEKSLSLTYPRRLGCEMDVKGRLVHVLECKQVHCRYNVFYGFDHWRELWSQARIVDLE